MHMAGLMDYFQHDAWAQIMMRELMREPPVDHLKVTYQQAQRADKELFMRLGEECRDGIHIDPVTGNRPLDQAIKIVKMEPQVRMLIMCMPTSKRSSSAIREQARVATEEPPGSVTVLDKVKREKKALVKAKAKARTLKRKEVTETKYGASKNPKGEEICFAYNTAGKGCSNPACKRKHECQRCFEGHPTFKHV
jgi:hypothetical protein